MPDSHLLPAAMVAAGTSMTRATRMAGAPPTQRRKTSNLTDADIARVERMKTSLRQLAEAHGLNIVDLARRAGLNNPNSLYNMLNGWSDDLSVRTMLKLCDAFPGLTLDQLAGRTAGPAEHVPAQYDAPATAQPADATRAEAPAQPVLPPDGIAMALLDLLQAAATLRAAASDLERRCHLLGAAVSTGRDTA